MHGWGSPRLGVRFDMSSGDLQIIRPDGWRFETYLDFARTGRRSNSLPHRSGGRQEQAQQHRTGTPAHELAEQKAERLAARLRASASIPRPEPPASWALFFVGEVAGHRQAGQVADDVVE